jgi:small subunit ribosomal protein S4
MADTKCKTCRRTGQKLFLKKDKCLSPKCPITRKPYPPGKRAKRVKASSEYGLQLKEKQKLKFMYGLREKQFVNYIKEAIENGGSKTGPYLMGLLESRLDNVVYKLGFTSSRSTSRQLVGHGHICVNGKKITIPSYQTSKGDKITIRAQSNAKKLFTDLDVRFKKYEAPSWLKLDKTKRTGEIAGKPEGEALVTETNLSSVLEFYSR